MTEQDPNQPSPANASRPADPDATVVWTPPTTNAPEVVTPAPAVAVQRERGGSRVRWGIALVVTLLVVAVSAAAFSLLAGQTAPSKLLGYVPADSVVYGEVRLDLPGDQRQKLGEFLAKFPGFADQSTLDAKLDEAFDRVIRGATKDSQDYTTKIKPWFGGEIGFSVGKLPTPGTSTTDPRALMVVSVTDAAKAKGWFDEVSASAPKTTDSYNGVDLVLVGEGRKKAAVGVVGSVMLVGDEASVKAAIDSKGAGSFGSNEQFKKSQAALDGDGLGYVFLDGRAYTDWIAAAAQASPGIGAGLDDATRRLIPQWFVLRIQARGDAIAMEAVAPSLPTKVHRENRVSKLAPHLPPSTIAIVDAHDYGAALLDLIDTYRTNPAMKDAFKQADQAAAVLGGFNAILGWVEDAGVVVTRDGTTLHGGIVFTSSDRAAGERLLATLRSFAVLAGGQSGITVHDEKDGDVTISIIDFGDLRDLAPTAGLGSLPFEGHVQIAYASTADLVVVGVGDTFVKSVLDTKAGSSLADDGRFKSLIARVGDRNVGDAFLDLTAIRELAENAAAKQPAFGEYLKEYQPYVVPLDAYVQATVIDGELDRTTAVIVTK
jgi:uncharacterized protein DUF3352